MTPTDTAALAAEVRQQLAIALDILDNPGGGLVFGYQALGQARARLAEQDTGHFESVIKLLEEAERQAIWRRFSHSREIIEQALRELPAA